MLRQFSLSRILTSLGRIRTRLLAVNLVVVLVPAAGLEFARVYERQLLSSLEREMINQAVLVKTQLEGAIERGETIGPPHEQWLTRAAQQTRTRIRLLTREQGIVCDSHRNGPPEGPEPDPPILARERYVKNAVYASDSSREKRAGTRQNPEDFARELLARAEVTKAFTGQRATATRVATNPSAVYLFLAEPVRIKSGTKLVVYVTRSTNPVLNELHRIRKGLIIVLLIAVVFTALLTLTLAWTISRPLEQLARAARRITSGDFAVDVPEGGGGEIAELGSAFADMTRKLENRHRYITRFAADVAHEFKSPLTSIRGAAELLAEGAADDPDARRRFLDNIKLDAARLDRLVSRLLELSRIDASEEPPAIVDLEQLVVRARLRSLGPENDIVLNYEASVPAIMGRETDLETALLNLLDNALRFSPPKAPVTVTVTGAAGDSSVTIRVADQGPGIAPENLPKIFDRFFTTDADVDGTGLGLAIVKSVVDAHGGSIRVETKQGAGTCFVLTLPVRLLKQQRRGSFSAP